MKWRITGYIPPRSSVTYDGRGSSYSAILEEYNDKPNRPAPCKGSRGSRPRALYYGGGGQTVTTDGIYEAGIGASDQPYYETQPLGPYISPWPPEWGITDPYNGIVEPTDEAEAYDAIWQSVNDAICEDEDGPRDKLAVATQRLTQLQACINGMLLKLEGVGR